ncbi:MAG: hypothetical protein G01um101433_584 [Parcubacteria group bacterium Gr01-1014_33]|nr:MAG: hypothetical protein G01um101433_584 [Parcubacteria group bacterium Gr01-1014_33]
MLKIFSFFIVLAIVGGIFFREKAADFLLSLPYVKEFAATRLNEIRVETDRFVIDELKKEKALPPPLRKEGVLPIEQGRLHREEIIRLTNQERGMQMRSLLAKSVELNRAAEEKLNDMFRQQFFAHVSPEGKDAGDLAKTQGYDYILVGENLALGNFSDDAALVRAWMESPGHRANILHARYREIGVAAGSGVFERRNVWIGVQIFGLPSSACPQLDDRLNSKIESATQEIETMEETLDELRKEIQATDSRSDPEYNKRVKEYNILVASHNALADETKTDVLRYNEQVKRVNECRTAGE